MKKILITLSLIFIFSLTACNKVSNVNIKPTTKKIVVENDNKIVESDASIIENENTTVENDIPIVEPNYKMENVENIDANDSTIKNDDAIVEPDNNSTKNYEPPTENIVTEDLFIENVIIPSSEYDAINNKTDNTIYFFISNSNADGFDIIETNVGTSDLKSVLNLAVSNYSSPTIPIGTSVNSAYIENRTAYIDLNSFFATDSQSSSSTYSFLKIYSIVNLAIYNKVFQVDKVVLSIEGGTIPYISQSFIPEFYTEKLFNKGTY